MEKAAFSLYEKKIGDAEARRAATRQLLVSQLASVICDPASRVTGEDIVEALEGWLHAEEILKGLR